MFKKNTGHLQHDIFGMQNTMPESLRKYATDSEEYHFYHLIYCHINEAIFSVLYSDKKSRPNAPINSLVAALILQNRRTWTYEELFQNMRFNLLVRLALGVDDLTSMPFCMATLFNFQNRLNEHFIHTGENLLEQVFDHLTEKQLKFLKLKTNIQRTDSTFAASNIRNYSRIQLLVEMIIRIHRLLSDQDKVRYAYLFKAFTEKSSGQYIYKLKASDLPHELKKIGKLFYWINRHLKESYGDHTVFKSFERVFNEHFTVVKRKVKVKGAKELHSGCIQSPDDLEATLRDKNGKKSKGQSINITETAHPENPVQLVDDVSVDANNIDESHVLNKRIEKITKKTPDLDELHFDGAYGSEANDLKFEERQIRPVQTAVRGPRASLEIEIEHVSESGYQVRCPYQRVASQKTRTRYKAVFDLNICSHCKKKSLCPTFVKKTARVFYFTHEDYLRKKRLRQIKEIPPERRKLRSNVEATINEFVCKMPKRKLKVRGAFKVSVFAYSVAMSVNFGRIYRLITKDPIAFSYIFESFKEQMLKQIFNSIFWVKYHLKRVLRFQRDGLNVFFCSYKGSF